MLEELCGPLAADPIPDNAPERAVQALQAQAAASAWSYQTTGDYPAPPMVARRLAEVAARLCADDRDPDMELIGIVMAAVAEYRATSVA